MTTKLATITTQYRKFNTNQVLTESQLNEFLDYFEDQVHMSRIGLSGVGIVCGFKVSYSKTLKSIKITQGYGVTTDGDLLALQNPPSLEANKKSNFLKSIDLPFKKYTHFRTYDNEKVKYKPFFYVGDTQIDLWELQVGAEIGNGDTSYSKLELLDNLEDKVVLLYLENYAKEGDLCTALTCDNQGIEQVAKLKVLLVSIEDAKYIAGFDNIYNEHDWYKTYLALPKVSAKRVILTCENTKTFKQLKQNYFNAIKTNETLTDLRLGYDVIFSKFNKPLISIEIAALFNFSAKAVPLDFQYRYDIFKDLIDTYNEIKELLLHINVHCCPDIGSFPKHLMLGKLEEVEAYQSLRHRFYKSPIIGHEDENYKKVICLINRAATLVTAYLKENKGDEIKITPSQTYGVLEHKAIPFYFDVNQKLLDHWSFKKFSNFNQNCNLSYHTENLSQSASIQQPLYFNIDNNNFYRIEGIQGKMYRDALEQVLKLKQENGLNFDVKMLSINVTKQTIDVNDYKCEFEDLNVLLKAWTTEQECVLSSMSSFFSGFSTKEVGKNVKTKEYTQVIGSVAATNDNVIAASDTPITMGTPAITAEISPEFNISKQPIRYDYKRFRKNIVEDHLTTEENTIGKYVKTAIVENKQGSANDIKSSAKKLLKGFVDTDEWNAKPKVKEFIVEDSVELMALSYVLTERIPENLIAVDTTVITRYEVTLKDVCALVKRLKVTYQTVSLKDRIKDILGLLINQLSTVCCSGEKLKILLAEIEKRKLEILLQIQLSQFVKKHPGLEHRAGVSVGGTFIMVYLTENIRDQSTFQPVALELDFLKQPNIDDDGLDGDEGILRLWNNRVSTKFAFLPRIVKHTQNALSEVVLIGETLEKTVSNFADFLNNTWSRAGYSGSSMAHASGKKLIIKLIDQSIRKEEHYIQFFNNAIVGTDQKIFFEENRVSINNISKKNTVVADFMVPYMCCSDCAPVNFIIPKEPVFLSLPEPFICLTEDIIPIPFTQSPITGIVKAVVPEGINGGVDKNENGEYIFNALLLDASLYGKEVHFTLNDEETNCKIIVYSVLNVSVATEIKYNENRTVATVTYTVSGDDFANIKTYKWNLGNGETSTQSPNANGEFTVEYNLPAGDNNTITPGLIVSNGFCPKEIVIPEIEFEDPVVVSLEIQETYCLDTSGTAEVEIPFTNVSPDNGIIETVGGPLTGVRIENKKLIIDPTKFTKFDTSIVFTINGLPTDAKIIIFESANFEIIQDPGSFNWVGEELHHSYFLGADLAPGTDVSTLTFKWIINSQVEGTQRTLRSNFLIEQGNNSFDVTLVVTTKNGCISQKELVINIPYPTFSLRLPNNILEYCLNDINTYAITVSPNIFGTQVKGLGVSVDANGNNILVPANIGATTTGTSTLSIGGNTLLTLALSQVPIAKFDHSIADGKLTLNNLSSPTDMYVWNVNGEIITRTNRSKVVRDTGSFNKAVISVSLTATNECGSGTFEQPEIIIREENTACIEKTAQVIIEDSLGLSANVDVTTILKANILIPTINLYQEVRNNETVYLSGNKNDALNSLFVPLLKQTKDAMLGSVQDTFTLGILSNFYVAQIKLFYNILHCQSHDILTRDKTKIEVISNNMSAAFNELRLADITFDSNGTLKEYLTAYSEEPDIIVFISVFLKNKLIPLLL